MSEQYKPDRYSSVSPYLVVNDAHRVIDFLTTTFDATELRRYDESDGSIIHVEVQIDDSVVMIGEGSDEFPPFSSLVHVYVRDVDETFQDALEAGGVTVEEPTQREGDPDRRGTVEGPEGNKWAIATQSE